MAIILNGIALQDKLLASMKQRVESLSHPLRLDILLVGENTASLAYVKKKKQCAEKIGIQTYIHEFFDTAPQKEIIQTIRTLNKSPDVHGYIVQLPLPDHLHLPSIIEAMDPRKDVDGFTYHNTGKLFHRADPSTYLLPATGEAVMALLSEYKIPLKSKHVVIVGDGFIVGRPMAQLLLEEGATVTICNEYTQNLSHYTQQADILISATGKKHLISPEMISDNTVLIDVGFTKIDHHIYGDISPECAKKASYFSPVPGGVGPLTVTMLLANLIKTTSLPPQLR